MKQQIPHFVLLMTLIFASGCSADQYSAAAEKAINSDPRNAGIELNVRQLSDKRVQFEVIDVGQDKSAQDVFRAFLQFTGQMYEDNLEFQDTILASFGAQKYVVPKSHMKTTGEEFGTQNIVYTVRTFPENIQTLEGTPAFPHREGGVLYVSRVQMGDFAEMMKFWIVDSMLAKQEEESGLVNPEEFHDDDAF